MSIFSFTISDILILNFGRDRQRVKKEMFPISSVLALRGYIEVCRAENEKLTQRLHDVNQSSQQQSKTIRRLVDDNYKLSQAEANHRSFCVT